MWMGFLSSKNTALDWEGTDPTLRDCKCNTAFLLRVYDNRWVDPAACREPDAGDVSYATATTGGGSSGADLYSGGSSGHGNGAGYPFVGQHTHRRSFCNYFTDRWTNASHEVHFLLRAPVVSAG